MSVRWGAISDDLTDPQPVIGKYEPATLLLNLMMLRMRAPANQRLLIAPGRERENMVWVIDIRESLVVDKPMDLLKLRPKQFRNVKIALHLGGVREDLKQDNEHILLLIAFNASVAIEAWACYDDRSGDWIVARRMPFDMRADRRYNALRRHLSCGDA
jgi:hypothetical protein